MSVEIKVELTSHPKPRPAENALGFGKYFSDHMFVMDWSLGQGWHDPRIVPYAPLALDPAAAVLHYGQAAFDGFKAFRGPDGQVRVFRAERHCKRIRDGAERLCMPPIDAAFVEQALHELLRVDRSWIPSLPGTAMYVRPTLIATEAFLGVRPSEHYTFFMILTPVGAYYAEGLDPVKIWVEREQVRAVRGGLGSVKAAANYAASLNAAATAKKHGYAQVLWLDAVEHKWLEEVGTMNVFVRIGDEIVTPPLGGTILAGVTRDSILTLMRGWGLKVSERAISIDELVEADRAGTLKEVFGCGTAAVISPVGVLGLGEREQLVINGGKTGEIASRLYDEVTGIQTGVRPDPYGWMKIVE